MPSTNFIPRQTLIAAEWLNEIDADVFGVKSYGAVGDGITDDSAALRTAMEAAMASGSTLKIPKGVYLCTSAVAPTISGHLSIFLEPGAVIRGSSTINNRLWFLSDTSYTYNLSITGSGTFDGSLMPNSTPGNAWDILYTGGWKSIKIDGQTFYQGADYRTAGSDSSIFITNENSVISNNTFIGAWDLAIYLSGDASSANGYDCRILGNKFYGCQGGVGAKREFRKFIVSGNSFERCVTGVFTGEADSGPTLYPGLEMVVSNNTFLKCVNPVVVRVADGSVVANNVITDYGYDITDAVVSTTRGITVQGTKYATICNNFIAMDEFVADASHVAISLVRRTIDATDIESTDNIVNSNTIINARNGIVEGNLADRNRFVSNVFVGTVSAKYSLIGTASMYWDIEPASNRTHTRYGASGAAITAGVHEVVENDVAHLSQVLTPDGASWTLLIGDVTSPTVARVSYDHSVDRWSFRAGGSGSVFEIDSAGIRAGTFTGTADTPINGYVTVKDLAGNTRRLATVA